jgi:hypothetical protein
VVPALWEPLLNTAGCVLLSGLLTYGLHSLTFFSSKNQHSSFLLFGHLAEG